MTKEQITECNKKATERIKTKKYLPFDQKKKTIQQQNEKPNWTEELVLKVIQEAREEGHRHAQMRLSELRHQGPKWAVVDEMNDGKIVDTMLDVCGFAHLRIKATGKFYQLAKKISQDRIHRFNCQHDSYWGGGWLSIYDSTMRQEMSVNIAACKGQQEVLLQYGITSTVQSRID